MNRSIRIPPLHPRADFTSSTRLCSGAVKQKIYQFLHLLAVSSPSISAPPIPRSMQVRHGAGVNSPLTASFPVLRLNWQFQSLDRISGVGAVACRPIMPFSRRSSGRQRTGWRTWCTTSRCDAGATARCRRPETGSTFTPDWDSLWSARQVGQDTPDNSGEAGVSKTQVRRSNMGNLYRVHLRAGTKQCNSEIPRKRVGHRSRSTQLQFHHALSLGSNGAVAAENSEPDPWLRCYP
ncbi:hypothetical protein BDV59DRAFT_175511 [Aspergillus ambiguus]|uniref:uncharacterized protein n=1 Tax=Aspergillus ambiguus TaxID=176160 RepID=UPI003CCCA7C1